MLKDFGLLLVFASFKITRCENSDLPQVFISDLNFYPQNPPKPPRIFLTEKKFSLPQFCSNASEWEDVDLSIKILTDTAEEPERSAFASLINLIKFILIKEELPCLNAMTGPVVQVKRPEGTIFNLVPVENKQISRKIETALANKPKHRAPAIEFYDNIDISNMIPIWRPRGTRRRNQATMTSTNGTKVDCACKSGPKVLQNLGPGVTIGIGANLSPLAKIPSKSLCKCQALTLNVQPKRLSCDLQCQTLPSTNLKPVVIGCGGNCNICQKLTNPVLSGCPKLASPAVLTGCSCPKTNMVLGCCPCSNPVLACPNYSPDILPVTPCQAKQALTVLQSEAVPMMNCFGNLMKKVTTTVLMPY